MSRRPRRKAAHSRAPKAGLPPGTAIYVGQPRDGGVALRMMVYDPGGLVEHEHPEPAEGRQRVDQGRVVWMDCDGVHDVALITEICGAFGVHPLLQEDILNTQTRPKVDTHDGLVLFAVDMFRLQGDEPVVEHVSLVLGPGFLLSFQEGRAGDLFDPVRQRLRAGGGRIRTLGVDYLAHALVDAIVDGYFGVLEQIEERIDTVEQAAFESGDHDVPQQVHALKGDLAALRRSVWPLREAVARLQRAELPVVGKGTEPYWRDLYDHVVQVMDMVDAGRERLTGVLDLHLAATSHRLNDVMRVLTVVATVFMPLSWIAGIYGMNFQHMPELHWRWGYPLAVGSMIGAAVAMLGWFRYKRWL